MGARRDGHLAAAWRDRAAVIPGGSLTRSKKVFGVWAKTAEGCRIQAQDGRWYLDMLCGLGAISLGYRPHTLRRTQVYSVPSTLEVEAAEAVAAHVAPWADWVRFLKTGSEATHAAYRIAKATTGRSRVLRVAGGYHAWHEWPEQCEVLPHGYPPELEDDVAALIIEPQRFGGEDRAWLQACADRCRRMGTLLIFDSMIYGGRYALGGASSYFDLRPDLECFGKAFGNGAAVSFVVGTADTRAHGEIPSGTFSGETSGLEAVIEIIDTYRTHPIIPTLWARAKQLHEGLRSLLPSSLGMHSGPMPCSTIRWADNTINPGERLSQALLKRGVLWHPVTQFVMADHAEDDIAECLDAVREVLRTW